MGFGSRGVCSVLWFGVVGGGVGIDRFSRFVFFVFFAGYSFFSSSWVGVVFLGGSCVFGFIYGRIIGLFLFLFWVMS